MCEFQNINSKCCCSEVTIEIKSKKNIVSELWKSNVESSTFNLTINKDQVDLFLPTVIGQKFELYSSKGVESFGPQV